MTIKSRAIKLGKKFKIFRKNSDFFFLRIMWENGLSDLKSNEKLLVGNLIFYNFCIKFFRHLLPFSHKTLSESTYVDLVGTLFFLSCKVFYLVLGCMYECMFV
jgi:hypothetical protein